MTMPISYNQNAIPAGVNIQIFNPVATPCMRDHDCKRIEYTNVPTYPVNYYTHDYSNTKRTTENVVNEKKVINKEVIETIKEEKQKKNVIKITDEYVKALENYLESPDVEKRILASKDILDRVQEDDSRRDNQALTALTNKMLKDPYQPIRFLALGILEDRLITGNDETVEILKKVEQGRYSKSGNTDQDAIKASNVLLKMTRKVQE